MNIDSTQKPNLLRRIAASKYLRREVPPISVREIIYWWELRRVPFNLAVGIAGLITCVIWLFFLIALIIARPEIVKILKHRWYQTAGSSQFSELSSMQ